MDKRTKIICTLGPSVDTDELIRELITSGMDIARFNFSHGSHEEHLRRVELIKRIREELGSPCAMLLDTKGAEIRTGLLEDGQPIELEAGQTLTLTCDDIKGNRDRIHQNCQILPRHVNPGTEILIDDGLIALEVQAVEGNDILCLVKNRETLGEQKSINVPGVSVPLPAVTDSDRDDLLFGIEHGFDFVAASFVRDGYGVRAIRDFLNEHGGEDIAIIAKIENADAVENIEEIVDEADGIMVARGDLGVEVPEYLVPHIQKEIIHICNRNRKPVITATQMLDSMIRNPRPTRAEVGDVANAIYDGTDCVMLSGETAVGKYPISAVKTMARISEFTEQQIFEDEGYTHFASRTKTDDRAPVALAVATAALTTAEAVEAKCIVCPTMTGRTARLISSFRSPIPIYAVTPVPEVVRSMQLFWGIKPILGNVEGDMSQVIFNARNVVLAEGLVQEGDIAVFTSGDRATSPIVPDETGQIERYAPTNVMYVVQIREDNVEGEALMPAVRLK